jgi:glycosyltransferase involved in cell wall biosynthesis
MPEQARRLRVLHLIDAAIDQGGAERFAMGLVTHLPRDRFELWVCATRRIDSTVSNALAEAGIVQLNLGRRQKYDLHRMGRLISLMRRTRFDVLHAHMFGSNVWGTIIGRALRVPVIIAHEQTWAYEGQPFRRLVDGLVIGRLATKFVAVSSRDAERMVSFEHVPSHKVVMIPNAYVPRPGALQSDVRSELGIRPEAPLLATVAVMRPQKALDVLLNAFAKVRKVLPDAHLLLAGDGSCRTELEAEADRLDLGASVHFMGIRKDIDAILRAADTTVLSSDYEGTPLVVYETIVNGTPLVATDVGGLRDIVQDGYSARLVARRDPHALADAIVELLEAPDLRRRMAQRAAARIEEFSIGRAAERFSTLYEELWARTAADRGRTGAYA